MYTWYYSNYDTQIRCVADRYSGFYFSYRVGDNIKPKSIAVMLSLSVWNRCSINYLHKIAVCDGNIYTPLNKSHQDADLQANFT
jgi:hypothetical protein